MSVLRLVLQCLIALLLLLSVIGIFASDAHTGTAEKIVIGMFAAALIYAASRVRRLAREAPQA
jgi:hypothetical protein